MECVKCEVFEKILQNRLPFSVIIIHNQMKLLYQPVTK